MSDRLSKHTFETAVEFLEQYEATLLAASRDERKLGHHDLANAYVDSLKHVNDLIVKLYDISNEIDRLRDSAAKYSKYERDRELSRLNGGLIEWGQK